MYTVPVYWLIAVLNLALETKRALDPSSSFGLFNGKNSALQRDTFSLFKTLQPAGYGWSMDFFVNSWLKKLETIYAQQASGKSFATVPDMLRTIGMYPLTQVTAKEYFVNTLGWSEKLVEEFIMAATLMFYGQSITSISALSAYVPLAFLEDESQWSVVGGNWKIPVKVLEASGASLHKDEVTAVTRIDNDGKVQYKLTTRVEGDVPGNFDVVIIANPLNLSKTKYNYFPTNM